MRKAGYIFAAVLLMVIGVQAGTIQWDAGGGVDTEWNTPANWAGDSVPGTGTDPVDVALLGSASAIASVSSAYSPTGTNGVTLVMRNGGSLSIAADMELLNMRIGDSGSSGAAVTHTAGAVSGTGAGRH
jgi:hypothetical protein